MLTVLIMAGGHGLRLWPKSSSGVPKQFHSFGGGKTLLQAAVDRAILIVPRDRLFVGTNEAFQHLVRAQLPWIEDTNLILEPCSRDTAAAIGVAAKVISSRYPDAIMVALPADHVVQGDTAFADALLAAAEAATKGHLVTVGLPPTRPETGYGYIEIDASGMLDGIPTKVLRFVEKPDYAVATQYMSDGCHLWNSGMFVWGANTILSEIRQRVPELAVSIDQLDVDNPCSLDRKLFEAFPRVSIDRAVLEKSDRVWVVPARFGWDDLGSWSSLLRVSQVDSSGNSTSGNVITVDAQGCLVMDDEGVTAAIGLNDIIIVRSNEGTLVCRKDRVQDVKRVAEASAELAASLEAPQEGAPRIIPKPWGKEILWGLSGSYAGKILEVNAGHSLSLQFHRVKHETIYVQKGSGQLLLNGQIHELRPGIAFAIPPGVVHRMTAFSRLSLLEVSTPELDDVVRLEDHYGRTGEPVGPDR